MQSHCYPGLIRVIMLELTNHNYVPLTFSFQSFSMKEGMVTASHQFSTSSSYSNYAKITFKYVGQSYTINVTVQVQ